MGLEAMTRGGLSEKDGLESEKAVWNLARDKGSGKLLSSLAGAFLDTASVGHRLGTAATASATASATALPSSSIYLFQKKGLYCCITQN